MKLTEMKQILGEEEIRLTKSLGQNFLHDANQLQRIVQAANLQKSDKVLEIGPGLGPLTELLIPGARNMACSRCSFSSIMNRKNGSRFQPVAFSLSRMWIPPAYHFGVEISRCSRWNTEICLSKL